MRRMLLAVLLCLPLSVTGCGGGGAVPETKGEFKQDSTAELKKRLEEIAGHGWGGSSLGGLEGSISETLKDDPAKRDKMLADYKKLDAAPTPEVRKQVAKQMADQL